MPVWETIHQIPVILPILAILAGAVVATIFFLVQLLNRALLVERIKHTACELQRACHGARAADGRAENLPDPVIVNIHDRLVQYRQDLRRTNERARISRFILLPLVAGGFVGIGHLLGAIQGLDRIEQVTAQLQKVRHDLEEWRVKGQGLEKDFLTQATVNATVARQVEEYAHEKETLQDRLRKTEQLLADEKKERIELEVLVGKAEQRLAGLEESLHQKKHEAGTFLPIEGTSSPAGDIIEPDPTLDGSSERIFEETDLSSDNQRRLPVDATSHYTGRLEGQIAFEGKQRPSKAPWTGHHIYVLVRWGVAGWIVTDGHTNVNANGAVKGEFRVILPISTIRTLDVTAIATDTVYRRFQHVRFPDYKWKASTATIAVHRP